MAVIVPVLAKLPPVHAPGQNVAKFLKAGLYSVKSARVNWNDTSPALLFEVPANIFVVEIKIRVVTAINGTTPTVTIGDGDDPDGFFTSAEFVPATAIAGYRSSLKSAGPYAGGKLYETADTIDAVIAQTDTSAGVFEAWMFYRPFADVNEL